MLLLTLIKALKYVKHIYIEKHFTIASKLVNMIFRNIMTDRDGGNL